MPIVERNGVRFHVQELGGAGPPVVFVHGLLENMSTWYFTAAPEIARTHRVLLFDQRGHGRSELTPTGYGVPALAADLAAHVEAFAPDERVSLVGSSLGGTVVLRYAADRPDRVERLAIADASLPVVAGPELAQLAQADEEDIWGLLPSDARRYLATSPRRRTSITRLAKSLAPTAATELAADPDVADEELARIECPVLLLYGEHSYNRDARDRLLGVLPDARAVDLTAGHFIAREAAKEMTDALTRFLRG